MYSFWITVYFRVKVASFEAFFDSNAEGSLKYANKNIPKINIINEDENMVNIKDFNDTYKFQ